MEDLFDFTNACDHIGELIVENNILKELYLGKNKIKQKGGKFILNSLL